MVGALQVHRQGESSVCVASPAGSVTHVFSAPPIRVGDCLVLRFIVFMARSNDGVGFVACFLAELLPTMFDEFSLISECTERARDATSASPAVRIVMFDCAADGKN